MSLQRFFALGVLVLTAFTLTSCGTSSTPIEAVNPTIDQMDDLDVRWGLPRRSARAGASARRFSSDSETTSTKSESKPSTEGETSAPAKPQGNVDPSVIQGLR